MLLYVSKRNAELREKVFHANKVREHGARQIREAFRLTITPYVPGHSSSGTLPKAWSVHYKILRSLLWLLASFSVGHNYSEHLIQLGNTLLQIVPTYM